MKWLDGLLCAESMVEVDGFRDAEFYFEMNAWDDGRLDEFDQGFRDYLLNYKYRMENNND